MNNIQVELWLASQEITSSRLRSDKKENIGKVMEKTGVASVFETRKEEEIEALDTSDCISSTTTFQDGADPTNPAARFRFSSESEVSSTTSLTPCVKSKDV